MAAMASFTSKGARAPEPDMVMPEAARRQLANVRAVWRYVEDVEPEEGPQRPLVEIIQRGFLLPEELAQRYARLVFMCENRLEVGKKGLSALSFADIDTMVGEIMQRWGYHASPAQAAKAVPGRLRSEVDLDSEFTADMRDLKGVLLASSKTVDSFVEAVSLRLVNSGAMNPETIANVRKDFKPVLKALLQIASELSLSREFRDIFVDIVDKVCDRLRSAGVTASETDILFETLADGFQKLDLPGDRDWTAQWARYIYGIQFCVGIIFKVVP